MRTRRAPLDYEPAMHHTWGMNDEHAKRLKLGLARMKPGFLAEICWACKGTGRYEQSYNAGCGMGYYRMNGDCEYCKSRGLLMAAGPAPLSVVNQVIVATEIAA